MKKSKIYFQEQQRQGVLGWLILIFVISIFVIAAIKQIGFDKQFDDQAKSDLGLIVTAVVVSLSIVLLLVFSKLQTYINAQGIYIRYLPFQFKYKFIDWNTIEKVYLRRYNPIIEFGGWGIRRSLRGTAYIMKGRVGLQIVIMNRKKILLGTQEPEYMKNILTKLGKIM